jgi:hypothetical protein
LAAIFRRRSASFAISIASTIPFSGVTRPTKTRSSVRGRSGGVVSRVSPLWTMVHGTSG